MHVLNGIQTQMRTVGRVLEANFISDKAKEIAAWRDEFRERSESRILQPAVPIFGTGSR